MAGSAVIGSLRVDLGINTAAFDTGLKSLQKSMKSVGGTMQNIGKSMSMYLTAPIVGFGALTVKTAGDFEASMNRVGAATGATGAQFQALEDLARELGRTTTKSASETADMIEMLAKNGLTTEQILGGAADAAIKLSEATGGELSTSADVATNIMAQFHKTAKDLGPIVDQITGVTLQSQFGFEDYALAIGQAGGVAGSLGVSLTDFNATVAATSDVFNSGSDAGTSFKTFLLRLVPASDAAHEAMEKLGLEFFDASGKMKPMAAIAQELKEGLAGLSDEAKNDALNTIFGTDALRTALALGNEGAAGINAATEAINKKGIADEQAAARMKGFNGEMEKLSGAFDDLKLAIADSGLLEAVTQFVTKVADWVTVLANSNPEVLKWGSILAGLSATIGPVLIVLGTLATGIAAIGLPIAAVIIGLGALGAGMVALYENWDQVKANFPLIASVIEKSVAGLKVVFSGFLENARLAFTGISQLLSGDFSGAWDTAKAMVTNFADIFVNLVDVIFPGFKAKLPELIALVVGVANDLVNAFLDIPAKMIEIGGQIIDGLWQGLKAKWEDVKGWVTGIANYIPDIFREETDTHSPSRVMHTIGQDIMAGLSLGMEDKKDSVVSIATSTSGEVTNALKGTETAFQNVGASASSAFDGLGSSIGEAIKGTKEWSDVLSDVLGKFSDIALQGLSSAFGGGGGGGFLSSLLGGLLGFARGGSIMPGGAGGIDSQVVAFRKSPNERVDITKPGQQIGKSDRMSDIRVYVDQNGNWRAEVERISNGTVARAAPSIVDQANRNVMPTVAHHQTAKAGGDYRNG